MSRNPNAEMQVMFFCSKKSAEEYLGIYLTLGAPACEVQRVLPGFGGEGDVLLGAREENPGEGLQEKSPQVPSRQGSYIQCILRLFYESSWVDLSGHLYLKYRILILISGR